MAADVRTRLLVLLLNFSAKSAAETVGDDRGFSGADALATLLEIFISDALTAVHCCLGLGFGFGLGVGFGFGLGFGFGFGLGFGLGLGLGVGFGLGSIFVFDGVESDLAAGLVLAAGAAAGGGTRRT